MQLDSRSRLGLDSAFDLAILESALEGVVLEFVSSVPVSSSCKRP